MIEKLVKKRFGVAMWTTNSELFVRIRYKMRETRVSYPVNTPVDEAVLKTAIKLSNDFPNLVDINELKSEK